MPCSIQALPHRSCDSMKVNSIYTGFLIFIGSINLYSQEIKESQLVISQGQRFSENEISLEQMYIAAQQKKILQKYDEALEIYKKILDKNEVNASVHHDMARIYHAQKDADLAIASGKKATRYDPSNHWFQLTLVEIYEDFSYHEEAADLLADLMKSHSREELYDRRAQNLIKAGKRIEAIGVYDLADQLYGWNELRSDEKVDLYLSLGKEKDALNEVKKWSTREPRNTEYLVKLARYHDFRGNARKAKKIYEEVLEINPDLEEALMYISATRKYSESDLGTLINDPRIGIDNKILTLLPLLENGGREIINHCQSLTIQYPQSAKAHAIYGDALWMSNDVQGASQQYQKSLDINKSVFQVWEQLLLTLAVDESYERLGEVAKEAMDFYPNHAGPYHYYALSLFSKGNIEEASSVNEEAMFISEAGKGNLSENILILQAKILEIQDKRKEAISMITSIARIKRTAALMELLGDLYINDSDKIAAEKAWKEALKLGGNQSRITLKIQSI